MTETVPGGDERSTEIETAFRPWPAMWSLIIGFFMILLDTTIVSVANPAIMRGVGTDIGTVVWVTSAYLLGYAVPLLATGRLGDRWGQRRVYLLGLVVFTLSSAWCGFSTTIGWLIAARVVQGIGAACMSPQTMAVITKIFAPNERGKAMALWGATAGVATLVGPILGGVLVDALGWEWIFFVNVPIGIAGFLLALRYVPVLPTRPERLDPASVVLSGLGMLLLVFGIEEGQHYDWGEVVGGISIPLIIAVGVLVLVAFVWRQRSAGAGALVPLGLFRDRNFAVGNAVIVAVGFTVTSMSLPLAYYFQIARGMTPTQAALMLAPMAVVSLVLSPVVGRSLDRRDPRGMALAGMTSMALALVLYWAALENGWPIWSLLLISALQGVANSGVWGPIGNATVRNLEPSRAGAGSGVYNATRQVGSVLGAAAIAALMQARLTALLGTEATAASGGEWSGTLPASVVDGFASAMGQSLILPAAVAAAGAVLVALLARQEPRRRFDDRLGRDRSLDEDQGSSR